MKKDSHSQKKIFPYEFEIDIETRAGYVVARCAALPGCQAQGRSPKEAVDNLKNAIDLYFSTASPAYFESLETFTGIPIFYSLAEFKGRLFAATARTEFMSRVTVRLVPGSLILSPIVIPSFLPRTLKTPKKATTLLKFTALPLTVLRARKRCFLPGLI